LRKRLKIFLDRTFLPRWMVLIADMMMICVVFMFTYFLRFNLISSAVDVPKMMIQLAAAVPFFLFAAWMIKPHHGILRHSSVRDALAVFKTMCIGSLGLIALSYVGSQFYHDFKIPLSIIIVHYFISLVILILFRFTIAFAYHFLIRKPVAEESMMIYGAGSMGQITKNVIEKDSNLHYKLIGFIDDNPGLQRKKVDGLMVYSTEEAFSKIIDQQMVKEIIISITTPKISKERKMEFVDQCIEKNIRVKDVPESAEWLNGRFYANQIHDVMIEDLLGRDPIELDSTELSRWVHKTKIMVTGAAGSIGSEIVSQLMELYPHCICVVDQAESPLFDLVNTVAPKNKEVELVSVIADVTDSYRMRQLFERCVPDIIFHASAYKHVPLMEEHPYEALRANVLGTKVVADLAVEYGVGKFVMVSTDKAVNPTNIMGATKRICEIYTHSLYNQPGGKTNFITTRFGNVLGSNGSVIPLFRRQISLGGPVTVTDKEIIRYFMTIPEACRLVLEAGFMGEGGEIYLFDMGQPVRIYNLAEKMIRLSGFVPHKDIQIVESGLRPGEKLFEELLANREDHVPTYHEKILVATVKPYNFGWALHQINDLLDHLTLESVEQLVARMKKIVPEYKSQNSRFEILDQPVKENV
jgi:FlaA1/EpsC-like NDP-sugar epimerase